MDGGNKAVQPQTVEARLERRDLHSLVATVTVAYQGAVLHRVEATFVFSNICTMTPHNYI